jgi:hypothetical protein
VLSHRRARPSTGAPGYSPEVARTARRLPISAIETNCEHNLLMIRAPHTTLKSPSAQLELRVAKAPFGAQPAEVSRARGERGGPREGPSSRDRSRWKLYPNPIGSGTSCRKPVSAGSWSSLRRRCPLIERTPTGSPGWAPLSRNPRRSGPPPAPSREEERDPPHPRCLPLIGPPPKGCALAPSALPIKRAVLRS